MTKGFKHGLGFVFAFLLGCVAAPIVVPPLTAQNTAAGAQRWEYQWEQLRARNMTQILNEMGAQGWEYVGEGVFKRPL